MEGWLLCRVSLVHGVGVSMQVLYLGVCQFVVDVCLFVYLLVICVQERTSVEGTLFVYSR